MRAAYIRSIADVHGLHTRDSLGRTVLGYIDENKRAAFPLIPKCISAYECEKKCLHLPRPSHYFLVVWWCWILVDMLVAEWPGNVFSLRRTQKQTTLHIVIKLINVFVGPSNNGPRPNFLYPAWRRKEKKTLILWRYLYTNKFGKGREIGGSILPLYRRVSGII